MNKVFMKSGIVCGLALLIIVGNCFPGDLSGTITAKKKKYLPHTIVYVDVVEGKFNAPEKPIVIDQKQMQFHPHVLPILRGTTVDFLNSDKVAHNVFSPDEAAGKFNLGTWPQGETRSYTFDQPCETTCEAVLLCNVHPEMEAYVVVLQNPYFAVADEKGSFEILGIPAGEYILKVWHPKKGAADQTIVIGDKDTTDVTFALKKKKRK